MVKQAGGRKAINEDDALELRRLRNAARIAAIYHRNEQKFRRNPNLSHIVHASLHIFQFVVTLSIEIFHHLHHYYNHTMRELDETVPHLPEERNPIFFIYPSCMLASVVFAILWASKKILTKIPEIALVGCFLSAVLMLICGIMEMKHADTYIDLTEISDEELLLHPVFVHNFVMCILSIFCMTLYFVQSWVLFDYWMWIKKQRSAHEASHDLQASDSNIDTTTIGILEPRGKVTERNGKEKPGDPHPIPSLEQFPSLTQISNGAVQEEKHYNVVYCCFVDWYNYNRIKSKAKNPLHEFQVVHVL